MEVACSQNRAVRGGRSWVSTCPCVLGPRASVWPRRPRRVSRAVSRRSCRPTTRSCRRSASTVVAAWSPRVARGAEVLILDDPEQRAIVVVRDDGSEHAVAVERGSQPSTLEPSPDGRRVLVAGRRFLHAELHVDDAALRPIGDPMRRMAPNRGIDVACYIGDDRLLFPSSGQLRVHDTKGAILANVPTELHEWPNLAVASAQGDVLFRNGAGEAILVRTRGGEIVSHARIGTHVAHVFVHDEQLFATCHGLACRLHAQALV